MPEHYRVSLASLSHDGNHEMPWKTERDCLHLDLAIASAIEGSVGCMCDPPEILLAGVLQHLWEGGNAFRTEDDWPERMAKLEAFYKAALELMHSHDNRPSPYAGESGKPKKKKKGGA